MRSGLETMERAGMPRDGLLDAVRVPEGFGYLWSLFWELRCGGSEGFGGLRITWRDLADYQAVSGQSLDAFEVDAIMAMDRALRDGGHDGDRSNDAPA